MSNMPSSSSSSSSLPTPPNKRVALLTGVTGAIGTAIAKSLLKAQYSLILPVRNQAKAKQLLSSLRYDPSDIHLEQVDLDDIHSIQSLCQRINENYSHLHVLINNAAIVPATKIMTKDNLEQQFQVNILSYHLMMKYLSPLLSRTAQQSGQRNRIVNVASNYAGDLDLNDLQWQRRSYESNAAYRQSKACNRIQSYHAALLWDKDGIDVNAVHPGFVPSNLCRGLGFNGTESAEKGAATPVYVATSADINHITGKWIVDNRERACPWQKDRDTQQKLWQYCESLVK